MLFLMLNVFRFLNLSVFHICVSFYVLFTQVESFHLYLMVQNRHLFDYESQKGQAFLKDNKKRLKAYTWTDTGICFMIPDINKEDDSGEYTAYVEIEGNLLQQTIDITEIVGKSFICLDYL